MGAEQSSKANKEEPKLSQVEVEKLLNAQRKVYEQKCQEYMEKAAAESARTTQAQQTNLTQQANLTQQTTPGPQQMPKCMPMQHPLQQTMPVQQQIQQQNTMRPQPAQQAMPTSNNYGPTLTPIARNFQTQMAPNEVNMNASLERQRSPYSYGREQLINMRENFPTASNLYPNLNNAGPSCSSTRVHTFNFRNSNTIPEESFVMINHNRQTQRTQPSAPPLSTRDRSASRSRNKNINDALKCPVCKEMFGLQIFQCSNGHSICKKCHEYRRPCSTCGGTSTFRRNIDLERYVGETKVPCPHSKEGCRLYIKVVDMEFHVKECPFKELQCPAGCSWRGHLKQLSGHFDLSHPEQRKVDVDSEIRLLLSKNSQNIYLVLIGAFNFLFHVKVSNETVYMIVQLIGTKVSASKWSYEIHVFNKNENRRKFLFTDTCSSNIEPVADIFKEGKCSIVSAAYASSFLNNGSLSYKFYIKQTVESKPNGDLKKNKGN